MTSTAAGVRAEQSPPTGDCDSELYALLVASEFSGPVYDRVMTTLVAYAYQVVRAWLANGEIFRRCAEMRVRGLSGHEGWTAWSAEDVEDLLQETVSGGSSQFRATGLSGKGWRPGGASLTTYFVNACLFAFPQAYRSHRRQQDKQANALAGSRRAYDRYDVPDVADLADLRSTAEEALNDITDPRLRMVLRLHAEGYSYAEISALLADDTSPRAVEAMLYRHPRRNWGDADDR